MLDHQNKDMLIFEGLIGGQYWAQTRPLGDLYFAYPPGSEWRAGPSINLATSPDALHWKPHREPGIRPHAATVATARIGGGAPPILTDARLADAVARRRAQGDRRHLPNLLVAARPRRSRPGSIAPTIAPLLEANPELTRADRAPDVYARRRVHDRHRRCAAIITSSRRAKRDLACRITHIPKAALSA